MLDDPMSLKGRISSPLEAGPSVLDGHHLPPHLTPALEHASSRLARKSLHLTLVVVRRDYHVPLVKIPSQASPGVYTPITPATPPSSSSFSKLGFATGPVTALKQLVRNSSRQGYESNTARRIELGSSISSNTSMQSPGLESPGLRLRWPLSPTTPLSPPPMTPCTPSSAATDCPGPMTPGASSWLRLLHAPELSARDQKIQRAVFTKTAQKFGLGSSLTPAVSPTAYSLSSQLFTNSLIQNEVLFTSDGLTILSLDRLYSLKAALSSYSKTKSPLRLEDAVDELRRYILSSNGAKVTKSDLCRSYDWLKISPAAVSDLDRMYRRAYGGPDEVGAISGVKHAPPSGKAHRKGRSHAALPQMGEPSIRPDQDGFALDFDVGDLSPSQIGLAVTTFETSKPPSPRGPALTLQTMFVSRPLVLRSKWDYDDDDDDDDDGGDGKGGDEDNDGDRTARPLDSLPVGFVSWTNSTSTDHQVLGAGVASPDGSSLRDGAMTPNGYEDISPVTRGEWGFLMVDDAFRGGRTVAVETC